MIVPCTSLSDAIYANKMQEVGLAKWPGSTVGPCPLRASPTILAGEKNTGQSDHTRPHCQKMPRPVCYSFIHKSANWQRLWRCHTGEWSSPILNVKTPQNKMWKELWQRISIFIEFVELKHGWVCLGYRSAFCHYPNLNHNLPKECKLQVRSWLSHTCG